MHYPSFNHSRPLVAFVRNDLKSLAAADPFDPLAVHGSPRAASQRDNPAIAISSAAHRQLDGIFGQSAPVISPGGQNPLRRSTLPEQSTYFVIRKNIDFGPLGKTQIIQRTVPDEH